MSLGALSGYAINPARDLGPRLASWVTGWSTAMKEPGGSVYFWVPIIGPFIGGAIGPTSTTSSSATSCPSNPRCETVEDPTTGRRAVIRRDP